MSGFQEYFGETHNLVRQTVRKFVEREIYPFVDKWEKKGELPRSFIARQEKHVKAFLRKGMRIIAKNRWIRGWPFSLAAPQVVR